MNIPWVFTLVLFAGTVMGTVSNRVYNGDFAIPSQFPYFASLRLSNGDSCGGSLISKKSVLTAAHCLQIKDSAGNIKDLSPLIQEVLIGCITPTEVPGTRYCQKRRISSVYLHPDWNGKVSKESTDVAIISLDEPVTSIEPVTIALSATPGESADVIGFGQSESDTSGKVLTYARQTIQSIDGLYLITVPDTAGPCYGDSGGPLVTQRGLVGIVSYGTGLCDSLNDEDGYFYVPNVRSWITLYSTSLDEEVPSVNPSVPDGVSIATLENGVYTLEVVSGSCKKKYLSSVIKPSCSDTRLRLYSSSVVHKNRAKKKKKKKGEKSKMFKSPSLWKIVTKPSDQTIYLQSVPRDTCINMFVQSSKSQTTVLGPINEGWVLEKVSLQSDYVFLRSSKSYQYMSAGKNCKPSNRARNRTRLKFRIRIYMA